MNNRMSLEDFIFSIVCDIWCVLFFFLNWRNSISWFLFLLLRSKLSSVYSFEKNLFPLYHCNVFIFLLAVWSSIKIFLCMDCLNLFFKPHTGLFESFVWHLTLVIEYSQPHSVYWVIPFTLSGLVIDGPVIELC